MTTLRMPAINWDDLHEQKQELLKRIWDDKDDALWGIVHMIDAMQDIAADAGAWEFPATCDVCGALAEAEAVEWCGNCGCCVEHCQKDEGCPA
jgi:hypothetical protein